MGAPKKENRKPQKCTPSQIRFVEEILRGSNKKEAYLKAYPASLNWTDVAVNCKASELFRNEKVQKLYNQRLIQLQSREKRKTEWTREESIEKLKTMIDYAESEIDRIEKASEEELEYYAKSLQEAMESGKKTQIKRIIENMMAKKKARRLGKIPSDVILGAVSELNKMHGFNEQNISFEGSVTFAKEEELED